MSEKVDFKRLIEQEDKAKSIMDDIKKKFNEEVLPLVIKLGGTAYTVHDEIFIEVPNGADMAEISKLMESMGGEPKHCSSNINNGMKN